MKLSIALLAAPALAFAPQAQQARASVKVEGRVENYAASEPARHRADAATERRV